MNDVPEKPEDAAAILPEYYSRRAGIYDEMWHRDDPERQREQAAMAGEIKALFAGRRVLEVACGTGYWTQFAAETAASVVGVDLSSEMLALARQRPFPLQNVHFGIADAYDLASVHGEFDAAMANFWISHVPKLRLRSFIDGLHARLGSGAVVFVADNMFLPGVGGEQVSKPGCADTFKQRELPDGSRWEVIKNYYDEPELRDLFASASEWLRVRMGKSFWSVSYKLR